jgi:hypothetical protein
MHETGAMTNNSSMPTALHLLFDGELAARRRPNRQARRLPYNRVAHFMSIGGATRNEAGFGQKMRVFIGKFKDFLKQGGNEPAFARSYGAAWAGPGQN